MSNNQKKKRSLVGSYSASEINKIQAPAEAAQASPIKNTNKKLSGAYTADDIAKISRGSIIAATAQTSAPFSAQRSLEESKNPMWNVTAKGLQKEFGGNLTPENPYSVKNDPLYQARDAAKKDVEDADKEIADVEAAYKAYGMTGENARQGYYNPEASSAPVQKTEEATKLDQRYSAAKTKKDQAQVKLNAAEEQIAYRKILRNGDEDLFKQYRDARNISDSNFWQDVGFAMAGTANMSSTTARDAEAAANLRTQIKNKGYTDAEIDAYISLENDKNAEELREQTRKFVEEHPVIGNVAGVGMGVIGGIAGASGALLHPGERNTPFNFANEISQATNETTTQMIRDDITQKVKGPAGEYLSWAVEKGYQAAVASVESLIMMQPGGKFGEALMSLNAASQMYNDGLKNGLSTGKALMAAAAAGLFEYVFEHISLENLRVMKASGKEGFGHAVLDIVKQLGAEGSEEGFTDMANELYDYLVNGGLSNYNRTVQGYIDDGLSPEQAKKQYAQDLAKQIGESIIVGGLSGAYSAGAVRGELAASRAYVYGQTGRAVQQAAEDTEGGIKETLKPLTEALGDTEAGKKLAGVTDKTGALKTGKAVQQAVNTITETQVQTAKEALTSVGITEKEANKKARAFVNMFDGNINAANVASFMELANDEKAINALTDLLGNGTEYEGRRSSLGTFRRNVIKAAEQHPNIIQRAAEKLDRWVQRDEIKQAAKRGEVADESVKAVKEKTTDGLVTETAAKTDTGKVKVKGISGITDGNVQVIVDESGATEDLSKIKFADTVEGIRTKEIYDEVQRMMRGEEEYSVPMSVEGANLAIAFAQNTQGDVRVIMKELQAAYAAGTVAQAEETYKVESALDQGDAAIDAMYHAGLQQFKATPGVTRAGTAELTADQVNELKVLDNVFRKMGISLVVTDRLYANLNGKKVRLFGKTDANSKNIYVSLKDQRSDNVLSVAAFHELFHWIRYSGKISKGMQRVLTQNVINTIKNDPKLDYDEIYKQRAEAYDDLTQEEIEEEIAAQYFGTLMADRMAGRKVLQNVDKSTLEKILDHVRGFLEKIHDEITALANRTNDKTMLAALNTDMVQAEELLDMFENVLQGAISEKKALEEGNEYEWTQDKAEKEASGDISQQSEYSRALDRQMMDDADALNNEFIRKGISYVSPQTMYQARRVRKIIKDMLQRAEYDANGNRKLLLPEDIAGKGWVKNGAYGRTVEPTTVCPRSIGFDRLSEMIAGQLGRPLTVEESLAVAQNIGLLTNEIQCLYCYVAADRMAYNQAVIKFINDRDTVMDMLKNGKIKSEKDLLKEYLKLRGVKKASNPIKELVHLYYEAYENGGNLIQFSDVTDLNNNKSRLNDIRDRLKDSGMLEEFEQLRKYAQSATWAKKRIDYMAYSGDILTWSEEDIKELNEQFGLRFYSFSDYSAAFILDNMQTITDAAVRGLKGLAYTKATDFVRIFAPTGININVSVFGQMVDGEMHADEMQGAGWDETKALREKYDNVGAVFVAMDDASVEWALKQDWIDVVIPYHTVHAGGKVTEFFGWEDYKATQEDKKAKGWKKGMLKSIPPHLHNNDKATYMRLLEENHLQPRFPQWIDNENYMKLVNETRKSAADTPTLQPVFDQSAAMKSIRKMSQTGSYLEPLGGSNEAMQAFANVMTQQLKTTDEADLRDLQLESAAFVDEMSRLQEEAEKETKQSRAVGSEDEEINDFVRKSATAFSNVEESDFQKATEVSTGEIKYSIRLGEDPEKKIMVYKLMRLGAGNKLYPLFIDSASYVELKTWYDADSPNLEWLRDLTAGAYLIDDKTGTAMSLEEYAEQNKVKRKANPSKQDINDATNQGKRWVKIEEAEKINSRYGDNKRYYNYGINGSGSVETYAMRPGWHAGSLPSMRQIGKGPNKDLRDDNFVWVRGYVSADVDYQEEANQNADKDIPTHIPVNGYYLKATNADKVKSQADVIGWYVAGSFYPDEIISDAEARSVIDQWNKEHPDATVQYDYKRESGRDFDPKVDIKYSRALDDEYMEAVETGDTETQARLVEQAARAAGYTIKAYHGTKQFGFTIFDARMSDDNISLFTALDLETAKTYAENYDNLRRLNDKNYVKDTYYLDEMNLVMPIKEYNAVYGKPKGGVYELYINADGMLILEFGDEIEEDIYLPALWNKLPTDKYADLKEWAKGAEYVTTRDVAKYAHEKGYTGVIMKNVVDNGGSTTAKREITGESESTDIIAAFNSNSIKSADPVVYDDEGNVIPLSERFNSEEPDIRYSRVINQNAEEYAERMKSGSRERWAIMDIFKEMADAQAVFKILDETPDNMEKWRKIAKKYAYVRERKNGKATPEQIEEIAKRIDSAYHTIIDTGNAEAALYTLYKVTRDQIERAGHYETIGDSLAKDFRQEFMPNGKRVTVYIPENIVTDVAEYYGGRKDFRNKMFGMMNISYNESKGTPLDEFYDSLVQGNYGLEATTDPTTQINNMLALYNAYDEVWVSDKAGYTPEGMSVEDVATDAAINMMAEMLEAGAKKSEKFKEWKNQIKSLNEEIRTEQREGILKVLAEADAELEARLDVLQKQDLDSVAMEAEAERLRKEYELRSMRDAYSSEADEIRTGVNGNEMRMSEEQYAAYKAQVEAARAQEKEIWQKINEDQQKWWQQRYAETKGKWEGRYDQQQEWWKNRYSETKENLKKRYDEKYVEQQKWWQKRYADSKLIWEGKYEDQQDWWRQYYRNKLDEKQQWYQDALVKDTRQRQIKQQLKALTDIFTNDKKARFLPEEMQRDLMAFIQMFSEDRHVITSKSVEKLLDVISNQMNAEKNPDAGSLFGEFDEQLKKELQELKTALTKAEEQKTSEREEKGLQPTERKAIGINGKVYTQFMTIDQLDTLLDVIKHVRFLIESTNEAVINGKKQKVGDVAGRIMKEAANKKLNALKSMTKNWLADEYLTTKMLTPIYFFEEKIGGAMTELYEDFRDGADKWILRVDDGAKALEKAQEKYHYNKWKDDKKHFSFPETFDRDAWNVDLSVETRMQLYATLRREQINGMESSHLTEGGIVIAEELEKSKKIKNAISILTQKKNDKSDGKKLKQLEDALKEQANTERHTLSYEELKQIADSLTEEQKAYADAVVQFMSTVTSGWGNETSLKLTGLKRFTEGYYFPFQSSKSYLHTRLGVSDDTRLKNAGFTKRLQHGANTPLVLSGFTQVATEHIQQMALYSSMALPIENLQRVINYTPVVTDENGLPVQDEKGKTKRDTKNVKTAIANAYGDGAMRYINTFVTQVNGGIRSDPTDNIWNKMTSKFKGGAVMGNISVVIQQPTALMRAMAMIDPRYFFGTARVSDYKDMMAHAPVAMIKKMGKFDTGMGQTAVEYMMNEEKTLDEKAADLLGLGAEFADMVTWTNIWNACKRETKAMHKNVAYGSEEFYEITYKRFRDVVDYTQVYDSTLSKSELMRGPGSMTKMITAFMAEPTLSFNLLTQSGMHKNGRTINKGRALAAFIANIVVNSALKSLVGAWRDRDEDETFLERYLKRLTGDLVGSKTVLFLDGAWSPFGMIPWVKDVISLIQGYNVDRSDVSVVSDILGAAQNFIEAAKDYDGHFDLPDAYALMDLVGEISKLTNLPVAQVFKDVKGIANHITYNLNHPMHTTFETARQAMLEGMGVNGGPAGDAYDAVMQNNTEYINRKMQPDDRKIEKYLAQGYTAAEAKTRATNDAINSLYDLLAKGMAAKDDRITAAAEARYNGDYKRYNIIVDDILDDGFPNNAVMMAVNKLFKEWMPKDVDLNEISEKPLFTNDDLKNALTQKNPQAYADLRDLMVNAGKSNDSITEYATNYAKEQYEETLDTKNAKYYLTEFAGYSSSAADRKIANWRYNMMHPDGGLDASAFEKYYDKVADSGISVDVYESYWKFDKNAEGEDKNGDGKADSGTKKAEICEYIDSLDLTPAQKDVLYFLHSSWSANTKPTWKRK